MPQSTAVNRKYLETLYEQLDIKLDENGEKTQASGTSLQYVGFAVMCKDLIEYLAAAGIAGPPVTVFRNAYNTALSVDYLYLAEFHPLGYANVEAIDGIPKGLTKRVAGGNMDVHELTEPGLVSYLSSFFGWAFFREYSKDMKGPVTEAFGEQGLPGVFDNRKTGAVDLAEKLLSKAVPNEYYWYPVVVYLCILLYKTDFNTVR